MVKTKGKGKRRETAKNGHEVPVDLHRAFIFPNRMREQRRRKGFPKLLRLSATISEIPYIRLSKIERGEVIARADELRRIAAALGIAPADLLLDVSDPGFDIAAWAEPFTDGAAIDLEEERFAVMLGAALRARRTRDAELTIAAIERDYGLPPVNLSRVENALKPFARWNAATQQALFKLFGVADEAALRTRVAAELRAGRLEGFLDNIANPAARLERSRVRIGELAAELAKDPAPRAPATTAPAHAPVASSARALPVLGGALAAGLIADTPSGDTVDAPAGAGSRAFGLRVARATLGAGLPAQSIVVADPDRPPTPGGIAALREAQGWRLVSVGSDREGRMIGYSVNPELEIALDDCDPASLAGVVSATFP